MAKATNTQVQNFADQRMRVRCEQFRALYLACKDDIAAIDDVYTNVGAPDTTWADNRTDGPPHLLVANDLLAFNTAIHAVVALVEGGDATGFAGQYPIVLKACVRGVIA